MKTRSKKDYVGLQFIAMSLFIIYFFHRAYQTKGNETGLFYGRSIFNILVYVSCVLSVFVLYIVLKMVFNYIPCRSEINKVLFAFYSFFFIYCIYFLYKLYEKEIEVAAGHELYINSMRQNVSHLFFAFFMLIIISGLFFALRGGVVQKRFRYLISFNMALICSILTFTYDFFRNSHWGIYHVHAYINSIINVAKLMPYNDINSAIYGHYGILYLPFVRLLGNNTAAILYTITFFTFISYVCYFYVVSKLIKNNLYYGLVVLAVAGTSFTFFCGGQYFQVLPHRYLFPAITFAYLVSGIREKKWIVILEAVIGTGSIVFNLETGLIIIIVIAGYHLFREKRNCMNFMIEAVKWALYGITCIIGAYIIINLYNICVGGNFIGIRTFIYPFGSEEFHVFSGLRVPLPDAFAGCTLHIIVFTYTAIRTLDVLCIGNIDEHKRKKTLIMFTLALSGLGSLVYVMNRMVANNLSLSHIQLAILLGIYAEDFYSLQKIDCIEMMKESQKLFKVLMLSIAFFLTSWFALEGILCMGVAFKERAETVWIADFLEESIQIFKKEIPQDTLAFGIGIPELYYQMGWDTQLSITDWPDMNQYSREEVERKIGEEDAFVMMDGTNFEVPEKFKPLKQVITTDFTCTYYVKQ